MILHCSYEELTALDAAVERVLDAIDRGGVAAPPDVLPDLEELAPRLEGDISIETLDEQISIQKAVEFLLAGARERTDTFILDEYASAESAILSYFEYAHLLTVLDRVRQIGHEMRSIIEVMTGRPPDEATGRIPFDD
jgi:hypothetical protein